MFSVNKANPLYFIFILAALIFLADKFPNYGQKNYLADHGQVEGDESFLEQEFSKSDQSNGLAIIPNQLFFYFLSYLLICLGLFKYFLTLKTSFNFSSRSPPQIVL